MYFLSGIPSRHWQHITGFQGWEGEDKGGRKKLLPLLENTCFSASNNSTE